MRFPIPPTFAKLADALTTYFSDWYDALFTQIEDYTSEQLAPTGITGDLSAEISRMGRTASILVHLSGASSSGFFTLAVKPFGPQVFTVARMTIPPTLLGLASVDEDGIVSLPNFTLGDAVLVSGIILERD